jgi:hypothetical protein
VRLLKLAFLLFYHGFGETAIWKMGLLQSMFLGFLVSVAASVVGNYVSKWLNRYGKGK